VWALEVFDEGAQLFGLLFGEIGETQAKADGDVLVRHFAREFEPTTVGELDAKGQSLADVGFSGSVDKAPALREVGYARGTVSVSVPNGLQRDFHSVFSAAFAHIQTGTWEQLPG
jgi:hypothetical protein